MKKIFFFIVLIFPSLIFSQGQSKATIDWIPMTSAEKWSAKYDREVLIFFCRKGCDYCERMKKEVLSDPLVIKTINENFLPVMLDGKSKKPIMFNGKEYVLEYGIKADFALVKAETADRYGNLLYHATARNFGPIMSTASKVAIVQAKKIVEAGQIDPESVVTPGIFVQKVVEIINPADESKLVEQEISYL